MRQYHTTAKHNGQHHFLFAIALITGIGIFALDVPGQIKQISRNYQASITAHQQQIDAALGE